MVFGPDIAALLESLTRAPRRQVGNIGNELLRQLPSMGGPMISRRPTTMPRTGAAPRQGGNLLHRTRIGDTFGSIVGELGAAFGQVQAQPQDPMMALYDQLVKQLQSPVDMPTGINTQDLMNQVKSAINPIYDQRAQAAQGQSDRARGEVKNMYRALSNDYERLAPQQVQQAKAAQEEIKALYGQLRSNVQGDFSRISEEQGDLFKQLGIEAAAPEVMEAQSDPVEEVLAAASETQAQQQQRYLDMGQADATYYREGSPNATMAGNEISAGILADLQDYLNQVGAERTAAIQSGYMDQLNNAQSMLMQKQQMAGQEAARRQEMLWQMLQGQLQGGQQQQALTPDTFMSQLPANQQQAVAGAFTRLQRSPEAVYGKVEDKRNPVPGTFVETTPQWYMAQADEMLKRGEIDPVTHQALLMYLQLNFGNK